MLHALTGEKPRKISWDGPPQEVSMQQKLFITIQSAVVAVLLALSIFFAASTHNTQLSVDELRLARMVDHAWLNSDKMLERVKISWDHKTVYLAISYSGKSPANLSQNDVFPAIVSDLQAEIKHTFNKDLNAWVYICGTDASNPVLFKDGMYTVVNFDHLKKYLKR